ncbi:MULTISPECIES: ROK family transcriptional regulator [Mesorhizobium]|jgi:predicted NBD/HSP70 family sugar kinase|uniref:Transcriptional regulator n=1 Tax=Rhizobium loti TaxID=381 RepID=A0A8E2W8T3_RHILI|nr:MULTISPECIES: ROK family transcriptional regulator [Mesorhizobium]AZO43718.1 ROK family transcriptional regulator [Mesorhizobium sp. M7D.F.Ca.US.005.01.1.1]PWJ88870.1 transcriptional regulator [Mesorhizobium loti]RUX91643.1 ROK family transcriptional regulator [Mesorhizobium sp. M7D.F.Ca.US.004.01.2.1]RVA32671.1 ROK family transcriptional regulator [Mesorhizobium sp. M7D.F.Ca.US.004.03.1.1]
MALRGTNQEFGRPYNRRIVLESIRLHGPIARGEIARRVGLTVQTVSTIVRELEDQGYILSLREEPKGRGLPPATLRINPEGGYAVGVHITPLGISAALINLSGDVIESNYREAPNAAPDHAFDLIGAMVIELTRLRAGGRVLGVGLALPGPFGVESMSFVGPTTMTGWKDVALRERLAASTGLPAFFETDMAAAAMGERLYGLGAQFSEYYYLYFGVGLGGVMVHDGGALRGAWGNAGEIGHIPVVPGGEACPCGNSGCLERYLSLEALRRWNGSEADWVAEVGPIFHNAVAIIENLFDPETVILGGLASADLLERLAGSAGGLHNSVSARKDRTTPRILVARGGQHSVLRGAAALAVSGVLSPRFGQMFAAERERERDLLKAREIAA